MDVSTSEHVTARRHVSTSQHVVSGGFVRVWCFGLFSARVVCVVHVVRLYIIRTCSGVCIRDDRAAYRQNGRNVVF